MALAFSTLAGRMSDECKVDEWAESIWPSRICAQLQATWIFTIDTRVCGFGAKAGRFESVSERRTFPLVVRGTKVTEAMMDAGALKLIVRAGAGYNTIDVKAALMADASIVLTPSFDSQRSFASERYLLAAFTKV